jgi:hypothetical protein
VRVVQAACIPKASPILQFTYRGSFFIGMGKATWDKRVVRDIIRWMMWPEDPPLPRAEKLPVLGSKTDGGRVVSSGSDTFNKTSASTSSNLSSGSSADGEPKAL